MLNSKNTVYTNTPKKPLYLERLKNHPSLESTLLSLDKWLSNPFNRELISQVDNHELNIFSTSRPHSLKKINHILGKSYRCPVSKKWLFNTDFISVDSTGTIVGYFQAIIREVSGGTAHIAGYRTWRLGGTPYLFGKAQQEFYQWMYDNFDTITAVFGADTSFTKGDVTIRGESNTDTHLRDVFKRNEMSNLFAQPGAYRRLTSYPESQFFPYSGSGKDLNGDMRLYHTIQWVGGRGLKKGMTRENLPQISRDDGTKKLLNELNINADDFISSPH